MFVIEDWRDERFESGFVAVEGLAFEDCNEAHRVLREMKDKGELSEKAVVVLKQGECDE